MVPGRCMCSPPESPGRPWGLASRWDVTDLTGRGEVKAWVTELKFRSAG